MKVLNISKTSYYRWKTKILNNLDLKCHNDVKICNLIAKTLKNRKTMIYGYRRMTEFLKNKYNIVSTIKIIRKIMYDHKYKAKIRHQWTYINTEKEIKIYETNLIKHNYKTTNSCEKWCMDIKYIQTLQGTIFLNIVRDFHSLAILGYEISDNLSFDNLVKPALEAALKIVNFSKNIILHTDNGTQYKSEKFYNFCSQYNLKTSKSKPGVSTDNALAENFFSHLSAEWIKSKIYKTRVEAINDTKDYIEFYNYERICSKFSNSCWDNIKILR